MNAKARRSLTIVGMGVVAGAALGLSGTAASAAAPTDIAVPVAAGHTSTAGQTDRGAGHADRGADSKNDHKDGRQNGRDGDGGRNDNDRGNDNNDRGDHDNGRGDHNDGRGNDGGRDHRDGRGDDRDNRGHQHNVRFVPKTRTFTVDYYRSRHACQSDARAGVRRGTWDKASCQQVGHRHLYKLTATVYQGRHRTA